MLMYNWEHFYFFSKVFCLHSTGAPQEMPCCFFFLFVFLSLFTSALKGSSICVGLEPIHLWNVDLGALACHMTKGGLVLCSSRPWAQSMHCWLCIQTDSVDGQWIWTKHPSVVNVNQVKEMCLFSRQNDSCWIFLGEQTLPFSLLSDK